METTLKAAIPKSSSKSHFQVAAEGNSESEASDLEYLEVKEHEIVKKLNYHILYKFCILTVLNYVDRTNLAFAAIQLNKDLNFSDTVYGFGSSVFFVGYSLFQVPSNLILLRVGGRIWLSFIIIAWGVVATGFAGMQGKTSFYVLRFLLGLAECGTFPGMWYHMSLFYTQSQLGVAYAAIVASVVMSQVLGGPLAAVLLSLHGFLGLPGWRWLFVVEGVPTIVFGVYLFFTLVETPETASFLTKNEKEFIQKRMASDKAKSVGASTQSWDGAGNPRTWYCALISFQSAIAKYAILYWCPLIIVSLVGDSMPADKRDWVVALMTGVPFGMAAGATLMIAKNSKATGELKRHVWIPMAAAAMALFLLPGALNTSSVLAFMLLIPATLLWANEGVFMSWPATFLQGAAAATGVALINSIGNCGGMVGPYLMGALKQHEGNFGTAVTLLAMITCLNTALAAMFPLPPKNHSEAAGGKAGGGMTKSNAALTHKSGGV